MNEKAEQSANVCFSYDLRGKHSEKASHWQDKDYFNDRAFFRTTTGPASLSVNHIGEADEGEYRCRVDFTTSPTRNSRIHLTVIGPYLAPRYPSRSDSRPELSGRSVNLREAYLNIQRHVTSQSLSFLNFWDFSRRAFLQRAGTMKEEIYASAEFAMD